MNRNEIATSVAKLLLEIKAVKLNSTSPFTWASGWKSPIYCDNRLTLSYPSIRTQIRDFLVQEISEKMPDAEIIAGVATAGIPQAALIAEAMNLPMVYVRSSAKDHGMRNQVEGLVQEGARVAVIEDLISTGGSSLKAVEAIQASGMPVGGVFSVFTYGFEAAKQQFEAVNIPSYSLSNYDTLLQVAKDMKILTQEELLSLQQWRVTPSTWAP